MARCFKYSIQRRLNTYDIMPQRHKWIAQNGHVGTRRFGDIWLWHEVSHVDITLPHNRNLARAKFSKIIPWPKMHLVQAGSDCLDHIQD